MYLYCQMTNGRRKFKYFLFIRRQSFLVKCLTFNFVCFILINLNGLLTFRLTTWYISLMYFGQKEKKNPQFSGIQWFVQYYKFLTSPLPSSHGAIYRNGISKMVSQIVKKYFECCHVNAASNFYIISTTAYHLGRNCCSSLSA